MQTLAQPPQEAFINLHRFARVCVAAFTLFIAGSALVEAQSITGTILGTVRDSSAAVILGSKILITNEATNVEYRSETSATGEFVAPNLPAGVYTVSAEADGFTRRVVKGVTVLATRSERVELVLDPGLVSQVIEVQAGAPVVNTENATIGNIMQSQAIVTLPVNGRTRLHFDDLAHGAGVEN